MATSFLLHLYRVQINKIIYRKADETLYIKKSISNEENNLIKQIFNSKIFFDFENRDKIKSKSKINLFLALKILKVDLINTVFDEFVEINDIEKQIDIKGEQYYLELNKSNDLFINGWLNETTANWVKYPTEKYAIKFVLDYESFEEDENYFKIKGKLNKVPISDTYILFSMIQAMMKEGRLISDTTKLLSPNDRAYFKSNKKGLFTFKYIFIQRIYTNHLFSFFKKMNIDKNIRTLRNASIANKFVNNNDEGEIDANYPLSSIDIIETDNQINFELNEIKRNLNNKISLSESMVKLINVKGQRTLRDKIKTKIWIENKFHCSFCKYKVTNSEQILPFAENNYLEDSRFKKMNFHHIVPIDFWDEYWIPEINKFKNLIKQKNFQEKMNLFNEFVNENFVLLCPTCHALLHAEIKDYEHSFSEIKTITKNLQKNNSKINEHWYKSNK